MSEGHVIDGGVVSVIVTVLEQLSDPPLPSSTVRVLSQTTEEPEDVSTVRIGVGLTESSKLAPGQLEAQEKDKGSLSGSLEPVPSSAKDVVVV